MKIVQRLSKNVLLKPNLKRVKDVDNLANRVCRENCVDVKPEILKGIFLARLPEANKDISSLINKKEKLDISNKLKKISDKQDKSKLQVDEILPFINTLGQKQLAEAFFKKGNYSNLDVQCLLMACQDVEKCRIALDVLSNIDYKIDNSKLEFLKLLKEQSKEKYEHVKNSTNLLKYINETVFFLSDDEENLLVKTDVSHFLKIDEAVGKILEGGFVDFPLDILLDIKLKDNNVYESLFESNMFNKDDINLLLNSDCIDNISSASLNEMIKAKKMKTGDDLAIREYVYNSDDLNEELKERLRNLISKFYLDDDIKVFRGDKTPWIFDKAPIDIDLRISMEQIMKNKSLDIKTEYITPDISKYSTFLSVNLYNYLINKDEYSLSDAMHLAKFGDKKYIKKICDCIKNTKLIDDRFKSTTLSPCFAKSWAGKNFSNSPNLFSELIIKKGCNAVYDSSFGCQWELILSDNKKIFEFNDVKYDDMGNCFILKGSVTQLD